MSTIVSIAEHYFDAFAVFCPPTRQTSAISVEAQAISRETIAVIDTIEHSHALFGEKADVISQLNAIAHECSEEGWDGNEANPVDEVARCFAEYFIRALPEDVPLPECAPEPDGSVSLDWIRSRTRLFSVSIGGSQRLACAWLDGSSKGHAVEHFDCGKIPQRVLNGIRSIMNGW